MDTVHQTIVEALSQAKKPILEHIPFEVVDSYYDDQIAKGNIKKESQYSFNTTGWVNLVNQDLPESVYLEAATREDPRISLKVKSQGWYFILHYHGVRYAGTCCFSHNPIILERIESNL